MSFRQLDFIVFVVGRRMTRTTAATHCTVARRIAVFVLRMFFGGKGSATFTFTSVVTAVVSARAFFVVAGRFMASATCVFGRAVARR